MAQLHKLRLRGFYSLGSAQNQTGEQLQTINFRNLDDSSDSMAEGSVDSIIGPTGTVRGVKNLVRKNRKRYNHLAAPILEVSYTRILLHAVQDCQFCLDHWCVLVWMQECCREDEEELRETLSEIIEDVDDSGISCQSSECEEVPVISPRSSTSESIAPISTAFTAQQPVYREDASKSHNFARDVSSQILLYQCFYHSFCV